MNKGLIDSKGDHFQQRAYALLIVLAVCTQLRWPGLPFGFAECGLALLGLVVVMLRRDTLLSTLRQYRVLVGFWIITGASLAVGGVLSAQAGRLSTGWLHDSLALLFAFGNGFVLLLLLGTSADVGRRVVALLAGATFAISLLAFALLVVDYARGSDALSAAFSANSFWPGRFSAWAVDPNQWAFLLLVVLMLVAVTARLTRAVAVLLVTMTWLLLEVRSDAALAGFGVFVLVFAVLAWWRVPERRGMALVMVALLCVLPLAFKVLTVSYPPSPVLRLVGMVTATQPTERMLRKAAHLDRMGALYIGQGTHKLQERMQLWRHGIEAWRLSPVVGLGPGAYSGVQRPLQNVESHNLLVQLLVNAGLAGVVAALALLGWLLVRLWGSESAVVWLAPILGVLAQGMGQYMMRHPVFWVVVVLAAWQAVHGRSPGAAGQAGNRHE